MALSWSNPSVIAFAGDKDPIAAIEDAARSLVLGARERGWNGPPFNPADLAPLFDAKLRPNSSVVDARVIREGQETVIEYNPQQPRERIRFSIAHEIAHLLFPDYHVEVRNRAHTGSGDAWQLEMLCNIAASEFVLPIGSLPATLSEMSLESLMVERRRFDVSAEAFLIRVSKIADTPLTMFVASSVEFSNQRKYRVDYSVSSATAKDFNLRGVVIPEQSSVRNCTAIGYTESEIGSWATGLPTRLEYVGIPGFASERFPRVAGLIRHDVADEDRQPIKYLHGDLLNVSRPGRKLICQLVNDKAIKWGGGTARKFAERFPTAEEQFTSKIMRIPPKSRIGTVIYTDLSEDIKLASIVGQEGFGPSLFPRIRYSALENGLRDVARMASIGNATIHLPKIGTGSAGGEWQIIEEILDNELVRQGLDVTVYELPPRRKQLELF